MDKLIPCYICSDPVDDIWIMKEDNSIIRTYGSIILHNKHYPVCTICYKIWNKAIEGLLKKIKNQRTKNESTM